jgi:hypothetical protein
MKDGTISKLTTSLETALNPVLTSLSLTREMILMIKKEQSRNTFITVLLPNLSSAYQLLLTLLVLTLVDQLPSTLDLRDKP